LYRITLHYVFTPAAAEPVLVVAEVSSISSTCYFRSSYVIRPAHRRQWSYDTQIYRIPLNDPFLQHSLLGMVAVTTNKKPSCR